MRESESERRPASTWVGGAWTIRVREEQGQRSSHRKVERKPLGAEGHKTAKMRGEKKEKQRKQTALKREKKWQKKNPDSFCASRFYE